MRLIIRLLLAKSNKKGHECPGQGYEDLFIFIFMYNTTGKYYWLHRLAVRTLPSHGRNRGSIPLGATIKAFLIKYGRLAREW